jgi:two-component system sensor histidine kinase HydH
MPLYRSGPRETLAPIFSGSAKRLVIGLREAQMEYGTRFAVAVRRTRPVGGAIVLNIDAAQLLEFRKSTGIGKLLQDLGNHAGIEYVVMQDRDGILVASGKVKEMSTIEKDSVLTEAMSRDSVFTRMIPFDSTEVYEVIKPFHYQGTIASVFRIGFSTEELRAAESRTMRRISIMSLLVIGIGVLIISALVINQNYQLVSQRYRSIQAFTGSILEQMQDAVITVDHADKVTIFNARAEELFGISADQVDGKNLKDLKTSKAGRCIVDLFSREDHPEEQELTCAASHPRIISVRLSVSTKADNSIESRTIVIRDLTEAKTLEREVQRKEKLTAMGQLASGVAHEIRNPLNAISMIAQRYEKEFVPRRKVKEYKSLNSILQKETQRVNGIIQQFLQFARPPKLQRRPVHIRQFIDQIVTLFEGQARSKKIRFEVKHGTEGSVTIDNDKMTQVLLNLLQNALDATPARGTITLSTLRHEENVSLAVEDNGSGIPADQLEKIFNLYYTTKRSGTGMGLAITQQLVSLHDGKIEVASKPGKGSKFTITIPIRPV